MEMLKNSDMLPLVGLHFTVTEEVQMTSLDLFRYQFLPSKELKI